MLPKVNYLKSKKQNGTKVTQTRNRTRAECKMKANEQVRVNQQRKPKYNRKKVNRSDQFYKSIKHENKQKNSLHQQTSKDDLFQYNQIET